MFDTSTEITIYWTYKYFIKEINIQNQTLFLDHMIDIKIFHSNLIKINRKSYKNINFYYIGYITIKTFGDSENVYSVNPLYLIIHSAASYFKGNNAKKNWIIDSIDKCDKFGLE